MCALTSGRVEERAALRRVSHTGQSGRSMLELPLRAARARPRVAWPRASSALLACLCAASWPRAWDERCVCARYAARGAGVTHAEEDGRSSRPVRMTKSTAKPVTSGPIAWPASPGRAALHARPNNRPCTRAAGPGSSSARQRAPAWRGLAESGPVPAMCDDASKRMDSDGPPN